MDALIWATLIVCSIFIVLMLIVLGCVVAFRRWTERRDRTLRPDVLIERLYTPRDP